MGFADSIGTARPIVQLTERGSFIADVIYAGWNKRFAHRAPSADSCQSSEPKRILFFEI
jgi:hypothetical protein